MTSPLRMFWQLGLGRMLEFGKEVEEEKAKQVTKRNRNC